MEISASTFVRNFSQYQDEAIKEPVIVKSHNRVVGVFLSHDDYIRLRRASRQAYRIEELPDELFAAIERSTYPTDEEIAAAGL